MTGAIVVFLRGCVQYVRTSFLWLRTYICKYVWLVLEAGFWGKHSAPPDDLHIAVRKHANTKSKLFNYKQQLGKQHAFQSIRCSFTTISAKDTRKHHGLQPSAMIIHNSTSSDSNRAKQYNVRRCERKQTSWLAAYCDVHSQQH